MRELEKHEVKERLKMLLKKIDSNPQKRAMLLKALRGDSTSPESKTERLRKGQRKNRLPRRINATK